LYPEIGRVIPHFLSSGFDFQFFRCISLSFTLVGSPQVLDARNAALKGGKIQDGFFPKALDVL